MSTIGVSHLRHLATFALVVECGSFAAAARKLGTSRSRVSEQIAELETLLAVRLIQRSTRKLSITSEGRQVYEQARTLPQILTEVDRVTSQEVPRGRVSLTVNTDIGITHLLPVLESFQQHYPEIQLDLRVDDERLDLIKEQIDLGIRIGLPRDDSLVARVLHEESQMIYASTAYLDRYGMPVSSEQLAEHRWITLSLMNTQGIQTLYQGGEPVQIRPLEYHLCNSPLMIQRMVMAGMGLGMLLPATVQQELASGLLSPVLPELQGARLTFSLVYPSRHQVPLRARCLIEHLLKAKLF